MFNANSVDPYQTPRSAASDLGLHRLPMSLLWDARHKWFKIKHNMPYHEKCVMMSDENRESPD